MVKLEAPSDHAWVKLAQLTSPHGVKGALKVKSFTEPPLSFADYALTDERGNPISLTIIGGTDSAPIVSIGGVTSREEAERWRNKALGVPREALHATAPAGGHLVSDLLGASVVDAKGNAIGMVDRVLNFGAGDILDIAFDDGRQEMFAFTDATFPSVDTQARRITMVPPTVLGSREEEGDGE